MACASDWSSLESPHDAFVHRHIGSNPEQLAQMLARLGYASLDSLSDAAIPTSIHMEGLLSLAPPTSEAEVTAELSTLLGRHRPTKCYLGMGYVPSQLPAVIQRSVLENPGWYTQYTPYQAEIAQGRLEALINFQTMVGSLTGFPLANASLLDEATAAAEAMVMARAAAKPGAKVLWVDSDCHPQTIAVVRTRASALGIAIRVGSLGEFEPEAADVFGVLVQWPGSSGCIEDPRPLFERCRASKVVVITATCLLASTLLLSPAELGADIAIGSTQRFGLPLGFGGPHAAFLATGDAYRRLVPGRIVGQSRDSAGDVAYRLALQTREQHIRRERASSNICTAQVLPAVIASFYAIYHGPEGLRSIAERLARLTWLLAEGLTRLGYPPAHGAFFDTLCIPVAPAARAQILLRAAELGLELRDDLPDSLGITLGEPTTTRDIEELLTAFAPNGTLPFALCDLAPQVKTALPSTLRRSSQFLPQAVFASYHTEHELLRYIHRLQSRDLSLVTSMIPLGSCTMKLNPSAAMMPLTWPAVAQPHPYTKPEYSVGLQKIAADLMAWLAEITGMDSVSLQPNSGAQGEYSGLLAIRAYHAARGQAERDVCLIPASAHGTNPASATLAGLTVVGVACDAQGNVALSDLAAKATLHQARLAALMITYPSTHGVFEEGIQKACSIVHDHGGQVYLDGANLNAQVGLSRPGDYGADVCHINLHKTFAIPHGGGGPGSGPIAVKSHLSSLLPAHPLLSTESSPVGATAAAPFGSGSILVISWMYIRMMGGAGLRKATQCALLNANYMASRLSAHYPILYLGSNGLCAHEFILDARPLKKTAGIEVEDIAKRLMDYGFHAPTMSFPVPGTLMIEPTESESMVELDRFCDALIQIRVEISAIEEGRMDRADNPLKNAPHTARAVTSPDWNHGYSRQQAAFPDAFTRAHKFWPAVGRIYNAAGDRSLVATLPVPSSKD